MKKILEEKEFEKRQDQALGSLAYKLYVKEGICLKQTSQILGMGAEETVDLIKKKLKSLTYKSDSDEVKLKKEKKAIEETRELYKELDELDDEGYFDELDDVFDNPPKRLNSDWDYSPVSITEKEEDKEEMADETPPLWDFDDEYYYKKDKEKEEESLKKQNITEKKENKMEKKKEKKYPHLGFSLNSALIIAAIVAFLLGMGLVYCLNHMGTSEARKPAYAATIKGEYYDIETKLAEALALRNNCVSELKVLEDEIKTGLFKYQKATEYLALYENQITYLKGLQEGVVEAIEDDNGNYSSYQSLY